MAPKRSRGGAHQGTEGQDVLLVWAPHAHEASGGVGNQAPSMNHALPASSLVLSIGRSASSLVSSAPTMATVCASLSERSGQLPERTSLGGSEGVCAVGREPIPLLKSASCWMLPDRVRLRCRQPARCPVGRTSTLRLRPRPVIQSLITTRESSARL